MYDDDTGIKCTQCAYLKCATISSDKYNNAMSVDVVVVSQSHRQNNIYHRRKKRLLVKVFHFTRRRRRYITVEVYIRTFIYVFGTTIREPLIPNDDQSTRLCCVHCWPIIQKVYTNKKKKWPYTLIRSAMPRFRKKFTLSQSQFIFFAGFTCTRRRKGSISRSDWKICHLWDHFHITFNPLAHSILIDLHGFTYVHTRTQTKLFFTCKSHHKNRWLVLAIKTKCNIKLPSWMKSLHCVASIRKKCVSIFISIYYYYCRSFL